MAPPGSGRRSPRPPGRRAACVYEGGPWYWVNVGAIYTQMATGTVVLGRGLRRFPPPYRRQTGAILVGAVDPVGRQCRSITVACSRAASIPRRVAFAASGLCFAWGLYRYRLFGLVPVAREMVIDSMDDGVLVLDADRRIVDMNAAAERYTGCSPASLGPADRRGGVVVDGRRHGAAGVHRPADDRQDGAGAALLRGEGVARPRSAAAVRGVARRRRTTSRRGGAERPSATPSIAACRNSRSRRA